MDYKAFVVKLIIVLIVLYVLIGLYLFFFQKSMLYFPNDQDFDSCPGFLDYEKKNIDGTRIYFKEQSNERVVIYYHGNAGSSCNRASVKDVFEEVGASVIFVEYAGFSNDEVKPSKRRILKNVEDVASFVEEKGYDNVVLYGQSLGSGAASYHASISRVDELILATPFSSIADVAQSMYVIYPAKLILTENFDNVKWLKDFDGRLHIIHGDSDRVIPHRFSQKLFDSIEMEDKEYTLIKGYGHNDIWSSETYKEKIKDILKR